MIKLSNSSRAFLYLIHFQHLSYPFLKGLLLAYNNIAFAT